jgi:hypothetical protein
LVSGSFSLSPHRLHRRCAYARAAAQSERTHANWLDACRFFLTSSLFQVFQNAIAFFLTPLLLLRLLLRLLRLLIFWLLNPPLPPLSSLIYRFAPFSFPQIFDSQESIFFLFLNFFLQSFFFFYFALCISFAWN